MSPLVRALPHPEQLEQPTSGGDIQSDVMLLRILVGCGHGREGETEYITEWKSECIGDLCDHNRLTRTSASSPYPSSLQSPLHPSPSLSVSVSLQFRRNSLPYRQVSHGSSS